MFYFQHVGPPPPNAAKDAPTIETESVEAVEPAATPAIKKSYTRYYVIAGCIAFAGLVAFIALDIIFFGTVHQNTATEWTNQKLADKDVQRHLITAIPRWIARILSKH